MNRQFLLAASVLVTGLAAGLGAAPAAAQEAAGNERVMMVTIRPGEACPAAEDPDTIVVCDEIEDPYRIPSNLRQGRSPENRSWADRTRDLEDVGVSGPGSCTNIGGGSELGCTAQFIADNVEERRNGPATLYSEQIAAVRAERLSTIDADAAMTQSRVEAIEREYLARENAQSEELLPDESTAPRPEVVDPDAIPQRPLTTPQ